MNLFEFWYFNKIILFKQTCYSGFYFKCLKCKTNWNESQSKANELIWNARKHIEYNRMISNPSEKPIFNMKLDVIEKPGYEFQIGLPA